MIIKTLDHVIQGYSQRLIYLKFGGGTQSADTGEKGDVGVDNIPDLEPANINTGDFLHNGTNMGDNPSMQDSYFPTQYLKLV